MPGRDEPAGSSGGAAIAIRAATAADATAAAVLIEASFGQLAAADWSAAARDRFVNEEACAETLEQRIPCSPVALVAAAEERIIGFALMPAPDVLGMLFVHPAWLRRGVARALWETARARIESDYPQVRTVELNSTPYAVDAYRALGFVPISKTFLVDGCRATRMACWLPARGLNAEPDNSARGPTGPEPTERPVDATRRAD